MATFTTPLHRPLRTQPDAKPRRLCTLSRPSRTTVKVSASLPSFGQFRCPYQTLGVTQGADEQSIKKAYRKLALQFHPDVNKAADAELQFLTITEAYDFLVGLARGKEVQETGKTNGWDFHDWYWSFRMNRSYQRQSTGRPASPGAQQPGAQQPQTREALRSQLAGLRQRAAIRVTKNAQQDSQQQHASAASQEAAQEEALDASSNHYEEAQHHASGSHADAEHVAIYSADLPSDSGEPTASPWSSGSAPQGQFDAQKRQFAANTNSRDALRNQLAGLRRKADIKQSMFRTS